MPDLTVVLDLPAAIGLSRVVAPDKLESEPADFHERVRERFLEQARRGGARYLVIDATSPIDVIAAEVRDRLEPLLPLTAAEQREIELRRNAEEAERQRAADELAREKAAAAAERAAQEQAAAEERAAAAAKRKADDEARRAAAVLARQQARAEKEARRAAEAEQRAQARQRPRQSGPRWRRLGLPQRPKPAARGMPPAVARRKPVRRPRLPAPSRPTRRRARSAWPTSSSVPTTTRRFSCPASTSPGTTDDATGPAQTRGGR